MWWNRRSSYIFIQINDKYTEDMTMKFSKEEQKLFTLNIIGLALCASAHIFPSGLNILAVIIGFILIGYYCIKSYELKKKAKDQTSETEEY